MTNTPLKLKRDKILQFLHIFNNADAFYITARFALQRGWFAIGCSNVHQAVELYIKAIIIIGGRVPIREHNLINLLRNYKSNDKYFLKLLEDSVSLDFLNELQTAYLESRYGESQMSGSTKEIIKLLDEIVFNLRSIYLTKINSPHTFIYVPSEDRKDFLKDNRYFKESDLTNDTFSQMGLPTPPLDPSSPFF